MLSVLFAALVALVAAQCNPEGSTYTDSNGNSLTFGTAVADWVPSLQNNGDVNNVDFLVWKQATTTRWQVTTFGTTASSDTIDASCDRWGQYSFNFANGCADLTIDVLADTCASRSSFLAGTSWSQVSPADGAACYAAGNTLSTTLAASDSQPVFGGESASIVFGEDTFALVSVGDQAVFVQRWRENDGHNVQIVDLGVYPTGYTTCEPTQVGTYLHVDNWGGESCAVRFCGTDDQCAFRAELFHNVAFNGFTGDQCSGTVTIPNAPQTQCSNGRQWLKDSVTCIEQAVEGGCAYCTGVAMGQTSTWCINRDGVGCTALGAAEVTKTFCNVEFECPASTASLSIVVLISALLALFFH